MRETDPTKKAAKKGTEVIKRKITPNNDANQGNRFTDVSSRKTYSSGKPIVSIDNVSNSEGNGRRVHTKAKGSPGYDPDKDSYFVKSEDDHILNKSPQYAKFMASIK
ncbi:hypothetical protein [Flavobacterium psychrophilum]|uniref:Uncharacterized protein n=1 Tax=Flavobacterium psychrophilum TaxID=96345 RepID=A0A7U2NEJ6_FLAPS|nr:hypothetical protein [Flavobacterium psychrophilum]QRE03493.1 hypothetical protein H0H26_11470 [Flavobacterium psychrophilum]